jgi:hypothetical protein
MKMHKLQPAQLSTDRLGERRASQRFPIVRDVQYEVTYRGGDPRSGVGTTVNVSSVGVLFATPEALAPGERIQLSISWPAQLDGKYALKLVAQGWIRRCRDYNVAVEIVSHEFRTRSSRGLMPAVNPSQ